ncbi:MAG TPA: hypothetical protein VIL88_18030 [Devosia sp.]|uniref:hypothetical protein n=1 Tax=Devosia sp. TaxID=1871048 RepID=UPI002F95C5D7
MILGYHWAILLVWLLGSAYILNSVANSLGLREMVENYARWGFPRNWHLVNGAVCLAIGILLLMPHTTPFGFILAGLHCLAIFLTLLVHRDGGHSVPLAILLSILTGAYWGNYGFAAPSF